MIQGKGITKSYDDLQVLKGVDIDIKEGEIVSIIGKSGAGKSTLLHIIGTLDQPDTGTIEINGVHTTDLKKKELAKFRKGERMQHKPQELSGGEQQRVAVARALINEPAVIFADEPTGNLDANSSDDLHKLIKKLQAEMGQTFLIVTHNEELSNLSDRTLTMQDGNIIR